VRLRAFASWLVLLAALVAIGFAVQSGLLGEMVSKEWIDQEVRGEGIAGLLLFVGVSALATALALPRQIVSFLGGYAFGFVTGTLLALAATELGCILTFYFARGLGRPLVSARFGERVKRMEDFLVANTFTMTLIIRLLPIGHNFTTSVVAGLSRVRAAPYLLGSLVGLAPQTVVFALAGSGVELGAVARIAVAVLLFVASGLLGLWLYRRVKPSDTALAP
jgi:uncharacterized membrane protein YdjX (TVP38/TMEM64 family)